MKKEHKGSLLSGIFLVAGTCVGGGMLALPVATSMAGFIPSVVMMAICSTFMAITGLMFIEANLWLEEGAHIVTMSRRLLGPVGKVVAVLLYLFIGYASLVAYTAGGGELLAAGMSVLFGIEVAKIWGAVVCVVIFGIVVYFGNWVVGRVNDAIFFAMIAAYVVLIAAGISEVNPVNLLRQSWSSSVYAMPLMLTIFSYQVVVPSLVPYLKRDRRRLRWSIVGGAMLAFVFYVVWQALILGVVPFEGDVGLKQALIEGTGPGAAFRYHTSRPWISLVSDFFAFFALMTSFLGVGLGLFDFLADGIRIREKPFGKLGLALLVVVPSFFFAVVYPRAFLVALDTSGGFGDTILNGIIPALMVWSGRYYFKYRSDFKVRGGLTLLVIVILIALFILGVEILERVDILVPVQDLR